MSAPFRIVATEADVARFMSFVDVLPCGCWFWTGARSRGAGNSKWYGSFWLNGTTIRAHRFAHDVIGGKECPPGHHRDHSCRFSLCVNPDHIDAVTHERNEELKAERRLDGVAIILSAEAFLAGLRLDPGPYVVRRVAAAPASAEAPF